MGYKRIMLFTNSDNPHGDDAQLTVCYSVVPLLQFFSCLYSEVNHLNLRIGVGSVIWPEVLVCFLNCLSSIGNLVSIVNVIHLQ